MKNLAKEIVEIIQDYRIDDGIKIDVKHITRWANQFDANDRVFLLTELKPILEKTYFSKDKILNCMLENIKFLSQKLKYKNEIAFLLNAHYAKTQGIKKSQSEILHLFFKKVNDIYGIKKKHIGSNSKKSIIYFDDLLGTGKTTFRELKEWLNYVSKNNEKYHNLLTEDKFNLFVYHIGSHQWGRGNVDYQIKTVFGEEVRKRIKFYCTFNIENNPMSFNPMLNCVYPINQNIQIVNEYFENIDTGLYGAKYENYAFRKTNKPKNELFFSNSNNRIRYENILLLKGIDILSKVKNLKSNNLRPLGYTVVSHKTFGLGTQFFTWRNIPNNSPLVFWWETNGWYPLFPVKNRGIK